MERFAFPTPLPAERSQTVDRLRAGPLTVFKPVSFRPKVLS